MSKFEKLARAAVLCQQRYGETHAVSYQEDTVVVMRGKVGFRVAVARDGEVAVTRHRSKLGFFVTGISDGELADAQNAIRDVVARRLGALRCPYCRIALHDGDQCVMCRCAVPIAELIARASEPVPAGLFDRRCPWCSELAQPSSPAGEVVALRCRCGAAALDRPEDVARVFAQAGDRIESREGGVHGDRRFRWYRRM